MGTTKVGIYRGYYGPVPVDQAGQPLPKSQWLNKRPFSWVVRWYGTDGNRYSKSFESRKEAERFAETKQNQVRQGEGDQPRNCTLREFYAEHRELSKGSMSRNTLIMQLSTIRLLATRTGWERDLRKIASRDIEAFRAWRSEDGLAPATVNKDVKQLKRLFNLAISRSYVQAGRNPCVGVSLLKVGEKRPAYMSQEKFEQLYAQAANLIDRTVLVVFYTGGLRRKEGFCLTWDDVDFGRSIVHVARRRKDGYVQAWTPKDHERREIPLPQKAMDLLHHLKKQTPKDCPYVFMDAGRWQVYRECVDRGEWTETCDLINNVLRKFKTMLKRAGVGKYTLHDLRRSCITNWARSGTPIHVAQKLAGHADIQTTQKFYLSVQEDDLQAAREVQQRIVQGLNTADVSSATDQKLTNSALKRSFPKRKVFASGTQLPAESKVA